MDIEDKFKKLEEVDILDIYDEIAELPIPNDKVIDMCITIPCKVDLRRCNLVYLVEQKYKNKLSNYNQKKVLKWLNRNLPRIFTKPEVKYLHCHESLERRSKIEFIDRKSQVLAQLPSLVCNSSTDSNSEDCVIVAETNRESIVSQTSDGSNTLNTVIESQPKMSEEIIPGFLGLLEVSASSIQSTELPAVCSNSISSSQVIDGEAVATPLKSINPPVHPRKKTRSSLIQQSEGFSSQDDPFSTFNLDNIVTSTQEFG